MYIIKLAIKNIMHKKVRTVFTAVSIAIGVASILVISIISDLGKEAMNNELDSLGINGIMVSAKAADGSSILNSKDLTVIKSMDGVASVVPIVTASGSISTGGRLQPVIIWGIDSESQGLISFQLKGGEDISRKNVINCEYYCLVDEKIANSIGNTVELILDKKKFNIEIKGNVETDSGIMRSLAGDYIPPIVYLPYTTLQNMLGSEEISQIAVKVKNTNENADILGKNIERRLLGLKAETDTVSTQNLVQQRNRLNNLLNIISIALSAIGIVALVVAGISIMTVMMISVNERTKEIGIKRAIGAGKRTVVFELLAETVLICILGSVVGLFITYIISMVAENYGLNVYLSSVKIFLTVVSAVMGGVLFGIYPSILAAKLNPVDALRKD